MAAINLEDARNNATEAYNSLIDNLWEKNGERWFELSPMDVANTIEESGLKEVFGSDQAENVSMYIDVVYEPETDNFAETYYHPLVIQIGEVPPEYADNNEDYATDDGAARITIWDDGLNDLVSGSDVTAWNDARENVENLLDANIESINEYKIEISDGHDPDSVSNRTIDIAHIEGSDIHVIFDSDNDRIIDYHLEINDNLSLVDTKYSWGANGLNTDAIKEESQDKTTTHEIEISISYDENDEKETTVSIDGKEMFTETGDTEFDVVDFVNFCDDNSDSISIILDRGDTFDSRKVFENAVSSRTEWLDYLDEHADAAEYIGEHADDLGIDPETVTQQELVKTIDEVESSGVFNDVDSQDSDSAAGDENDGEKSEVSMADAVGLEQDVLDGVSSAIDESIDGLKEDTEKDDTDKEQDVDSEKNPDAESIDDETDEADIGDQDDIEDDNDDWDSGDPVD